MKHRRRSLSAAIIACLGALFVVPFTPPIAVAAADDNARLEPGRLVVETLSADTAAMPEHDRTIAPADIDSLTSHPSRPQGIAPVQPLAVDISQGFRLCFDPGTPEPVRVAATRAGSMWADALDVSGPTVEIDIKWIPFRSSSALGAAGPSTFVIHGALPEPATRYPVALANELLDTDFMVRQPCAPDRDGEVLLYLNSTAGGGSLWHLGTGPPPDEKVDLTSVVAHEIAHGLGFTGSAEIGDDDRLAWPDDGGAPYVFDRSVRTCPGNFACTSSQLQPITIGNLGPLTTGEVWFDGVGAPLQLHAPATWDVGSSFSHLSDETYPASTGVSLMTPYFERGENHSAIDGGTLSVLQRIGWRAATAPSSTSGVVVEPLDRAVKVTLGDADLSTGPPPTSHIVRIEREVIVDGISTFELAFEPLEIVDVETTINGLDNDVLYRLAVQGKNDAGLGPVVISDVFMPGSSSADPAAVDLARRVLLDLRERAGSPAEVSQLARSIQTNGAGPAVANLLVGPEFADHQAIVRLYLGFLDRTPERSGIEFWIDQSRAGEDLTSIATRFAAASSFELGGVLSDQAFVERVYQTILNRPAELEGLAYWVDRLNDGMPRGRLLLEVSESIEHRSINGPASQVIAAHVQFEDRVPTTAELAEGVERVNAGRFDAVVADLLAT